MMLTTLMLFGQINIIHKKNRPKAIEIQFLYNLLICAIHPRVYLVITLSVLECVLYYRVVLRSSKYIPNIKIGGDGCLTSGRFLSKAQVF